MQFWLLILRMFDIQITTNESDFLQMNESIVE